MVEQTIYLVPASNDQAYNHLVDTVIEGVPRSDLSEPPQEGADPLHIWGTKEKIGNEKSFERGDILLFYTGDRTYTQAAAIRNTTSNEGLARNLWGIDDTDATEDTEPWSHLIYLEPPIEIEIDGEMIADFADYGMDYVLGLQPLNEEGHSAIVNEFGSIPAFIAEHAVDADSTEIFQRSPLLKQATEEFEGEATPTEVVEASGGLPTASRWNAKCRKLIDILDRSNQVVVTGPPHTVTVGRVRRIAKRWLENEDFDPEEHIMTVSIDEETQYEDFVERPHPRPEAENGLTTTNGPFKRACRLAHAAKNEAEYEDEPVPDFVLLLDADPSVSLETVFGQLAYTLDPANRRRNPTLHLPHSGETLRVPRNLTILMVVENSATRSIPLSLHGRFRVVEESPDCPLLSEVYGYESVAEARRSVTANNDDIPALTITALDTINTSLMENGVRDPVLGHDLFIDYSGNAEGEEIGQYPSRTLLDIWQFTALPYLRTRLGDSTELPDELATLIWGSSEREFHEIPDGRDTLIERLQYFTKALEEEI